MIYNILVLLWYFPMRMPLYLFSSNSHPYCLPFCTSLANLWLGLFLSQRIHPYVFVSQVHMLSFTYFFEDHKILFLWSTILFPDLHKHIHIFLHTCVSMYICVVCMMSESLNFPPKLSPPHQGQGGKEWGVGSGGRGRKKGGREEADIFI